jgi:hypothetical protein
MNTQNHKDLIVNPWLTGQWISGKLYVVDVKHGKFILLSPKVGFFVCELNRNSNWNDAEEALLKNSQTKLTESELEELKTARILVSKSELENENHRAFLDNVKASDISFIDFPSPILETGEIPANVNGVSAPPPPPP